MTPFNLAIASSVGLESWIKGIEQRTARVGIVGLGYVGLPLALMFSEERFRVTGFDVDEGKVGSLNQGESYIHRIEQGHVRRAQASGFRATCDFAGIA